MGSIPNLRNYIFNIFISLLRFQRIKRKVKTIFNKKSPARPPRVPYKNLRSRAFSEIRLPISLSSDTLFELAALIPNVALQSKQVQSYYLLGFNYKCIIFIFFSKLVVPVDINCQISQF